MSKKTAVIIIAIIVIGVLFGLSALKKTQQDKSPEAGTQNLQAGQNSTQTQDLAPKRMQVEKSELPENFPGDFPIEAGAEILKNYNAEDKDSYQATRQFLSKKTLAENYKFYSDYFKASGWKIISSNDGKTAKSITAQKDGGTMSMSMNQSAAFKGVIVDASYVLKK